MHDGLTTAGIAILTLLSLAATGLALARVLGRVVIDPQGQMQRRLLWVCTAGSAAIFIYRAAVIYGRWQPQAYVDGLLLIATLLAATLIYLQSPGRVPGISAFGLSILTLLLAWAICASAWTWQPFHIDSVWLTVHLTALIVGTFFVTVAASAGFLYLFIAGRIRRKRDPVSSERLASLETAERLIVRTSALGFGLLTLGLATGLVLISMGKTEMGAGWWYSPKVLLGGVVWLIYAVVMNARHAATFRGKRAAWLSIAGLVLLLVTWAITTRLPVGRGVAMTNDKRQMTHDKFRSSVVGREFFISHWSIVVDHLEKSPTTTDFQEVQPCDS